MAIPTAPPPTALAPRFTNFSNALVGTMPVLKPLDANDSAIGVAYLAKAGTAVLTLVTALLNTPGTAIVKGLNTSPAKFAAPVTGE